MAEVKWFSASQDAGIFVETVEELYAALDILHTQVMDNIGEDSKALMILSDAMQALSDLYPDKDFIL